MANLRESEPALHSFRKITLTMNLNYGNWRQKKQLETYSNTSSKYGKNLN